MMLQSTEIHTGVMVVYTIGYKMSCGGGKGVETLPKSYMYSEP